MSMRGWIQSIACIVCLAVANPALAEVASSKGMATVSYQGKLSSAIRQQAMTRANLAALESYVAETWLAKAKIFSARRDEFSGQLDRFILGSTVLSENVNAQAKTYSVTVRADINSLQLQAALDAGSATATAGRGARSPIAVVFLARMQDSVQTFEAKEYRRVDVKSAGASSSDETARTTEGESIGRSSIGTSDAMSRSGTRRDSYSAITESGGSTTQKADRIQWKVSTASEVNTAMSGVLSGAGYEVVEAEYIEPYSGGQLSVDRIRKGFSEGDDLSPEILRATANGVRSADVPLLAIGTLDVGIRDQDPVSGLVRVTVTVTGKVLDVSGRFPRTVSSVGPVLFAGVGNTETVARTNALTLAAQKAAQVMVDEMNVRSVR